MDPDVLVTILDVPPEASPALVALVTVATLVTHRMECLVEIETGLSVKSPVTLVTLMCPRVNHFVNGEVVLPSCFVVTVLAGM